MIVIFTGSRSITAWTTFEEGLARLRKDFPADITEIWVGDAKDGVDAMARRYAEVSLKMKPRVFVADWDRFKPEPGRKNPAGMVRNEEMIKAGVAARASGQTVVVVAIWDGVSPGTSHCHKLAQKHGLPTVVMIAKADMPVPQEHIDEAMGRAPKEQPKTTPGRRRKDKNQFGLFDGLFAESRHNDEN